VNENPVLIDARGMFDGEEAERGWGPVIEGYEPRTLHRGGYMNRMKGSGCDRANCTKLRIEHCTCAIFGSGIRLTPILIVLSVFTIHLWVGCQGLKMNPVGCKGNQDLNTGLLILCQI